MKKRFLLLISIITLLTSSFSYSLAQQNGCLDCSGGTIRGIKFEDKNGNGIQDAGEPTVPGFYIQLNGPNPSPYPPLGTLQATMPNPSSGTLLGIAFDGFYFYYTVSQSTLLYKASTSGVVINTFNTGRLIGALTWDCNGKRLWAGSFDKSGEIWGVDRTTGQVIPGTLFTAPTQEWIDGLQYDERDKTLWYSPDGAPTVYHISLTGALLGSFQIPYQGANWFNSGIGFDGNNLWLALLDVPNHMTRIVKVTDTGYPLSYFDLSGWVEDIEFDCKTFQPDHVLWAQYIGPSAPKAFSIGSSGLSVTATTGAGSYSFISVPPGSYTVSEFSNVFNIGWTQTAPASGFYSIPTLNPVQTISNLNFGNRKSFWQQTVKLGVLKGEKDPINVALNRARKQISYSAIGQDVEMWYARLNEKDWVAPLLQDPKNLALAMHLVGIGRRLIEKNGVLRREDIPVIEEAFRIIEREAAPAPKGLIPEVMRRLRRSVGMRWPALTSILSGVSKSPKRSTR